MKKLFNNTFSLFLFPTKSCFISSKFPSDWKKANAVPVPNKNDKKIFKNYRPISLLPICRKTFELLIHNQMLNIFIENIIPSNPLGFTSGFINQLKSIAHEIYKSFCEGYLVRGVFLDTYAVFDKV